MNNRFNKDRSYNRYNRSEGNTFNRGGGDYQNGNKFNGNERRHSRNNATDKGYNDKERGRSYPDRNEFDNSQGKSRDSGISGRLQTTNWNDKKQFNSRNSRFNGN